MDLFTAHEKSLLFKFQAKLRLTRLCLVKLSYGQTYLKDFKFRIENLGSYYTLQSTEL
jgi:hypothetical protein